jgi:hypothetical protein
MIRKGGKPERMLQSLKSIKAEFPEAFTFGNLIMGLTGDSEESIIRNCNIIVDEQLLTSGGCNSLRIYENLENPDVKSDMDIDPNKFGYEIIGTDKEWAELGYSSQVWKNDWTNQHDADVLSERVDAILGEGLQSKFTAHEIHGLRTLVPGHDWSWYNDHFQLANRLREKVVRSYVKNKEKWLLGR